jgi:Ras-related protein Rab-1A
LEIQVTDILYTGAGKSMFLLSAVDQVFNESYLPTIGVDFKIRTFEIGNESVKL